MGSGTAGRISRASGVLSRIVSEEFLNRHPIWRRLGFNVIMSRLQSSAVLMLENNKYNPYPVGGAVAQTAEGFVQGGVRLVIHAVGMGYDSSGEYGGNKEMTVETIYSSIQKALLIADQHQIISIALPIMGVGRGGMSIDQSLGAMFAAIKQVSGQLKYLKSVQMIVSNNYEADAVLRSLGVTVQTQQRVSSKKVSVAGDATTLFSVKAGQSSYQVTVGLDSKSDIVLPSKVEKAKSPRLGTIKVDGNKAIYSGTEPFMVNGAYSNGNSASLADGDVIQFTTNGTRYVISFAGQRLTLTPLASGLYYYLSGLERRRDFYDTKESRSRDELNNLISTINNLERLNVNTERISALFNLYPSLANTLIHDEKGWYYLEGDSGENKVYLTEEETVAFNSIYQILMAIRAMPAQELNDFGIVIPEENTADFAEVRNFADSVSDISRHIGVINDLTEEVNSLSSTTNPTVSKYVEGIKTIISIWERGLIAPADIEMTLRTLLPPGSGAAIDQILRYGRQEASQDDLLGQDFARGFSGDGARFGYGNVPYGLIRILLLAEQSIVYRDVIPAGQNDLYRASMNAMNKSLEEAGITGFTLPEVFGEDSWIFNLRERALTDVDAHYQGYIGTIRPDNVGNDEAFAKKVALRKTHEALHQLLLALSTTNEGDYGPNSTEEAFTELYTRLLYDLDPTRALGYYDNSVTRLYLLIQEAGDLAGQTPLEFLSSILKRMNNEDSSITAALAASIEENCMGICPALGSGKYAEYMRGFTDLGNERASISDQELSKRLEEYKRTAITGSEVLKEAEKMGMGESPETPEQKRFVYRLVIKAIRSFRQKIDGKVIKGQFGQYIIRVQAISGSYARGNERLGIYGWSKSYEDSRRWEILNKVHDFGPTGLSDVDMKITIRKKDGKSEGVPIGDSMLIEKFLNQVLEKIFNETRILVTTHEINMDIERSVDEVLEELEAKAKTTRPTSGPSIPAAPQNIKPTADPLDEIETKLLSSPRISVGGQHMLPSVLLAMAHFNPGALGGYVSKHFDITREGLDDGSFDQLHTLALQINKRNSILNPGALPVVSETILNSAKPVTKKELEDAARGELAKKKKTTGDINTTKAVDLVDAEVKSLIAFYRMNAVANKWPPVEDAVLEHIFQKQAEEFIAKAIRAEYDTGKARLETETKANPGQTEDNLKTRVAVRLEELFGVSPLEKRNLLTSYKLTANVTSDASAIAKAAIKALNQPVTITIKGATFADVKAFEQRMKVEDKSGKHNWDLLLFDDGRKYFAAVDSNGIVRGAVEVVDTEKAGEGLITVLYIEESYRNSDYGTKLIQKAQESGWSRILVHPFVIGYLKTQTAADGRTADEQLKEFYRKAGFEVENDNMVWNKPLTEERIAQIAADLKSGKTLDDVGGAEAAYQALGKISELKLQRGKHTESDLEIFSNTIFAVLFRHATERMKTALGVHVEDPTALYNFELTEIAGEKVSGTTKEKALKAALDSIDKLKQQNAALSGKSSRDVLVELVMPFGITIPAESTGGSVDLQAKREALTRHLQVNRKDAGEVGQVILAVGTKLKEGQDLAGIEVEAQEAITKKAGAIVNNAITSLDALDAGFAANENQAEVKQKRAEARTKALEERKTLVALPKVPEKVTVAEFRDLIAQRLGRYLMLNGQPITDQTLLNAVSDYLLGVNESNAALVLAIRKFVDSHEVEAILPDEIIYENVINKENIREGDEAHEIGSTDYKLVRRKYTFSSDPESVKEVFVTKIGNIIMTTINRDLGQGLVVDLGREKEIAPIPVEVRKISVTALISSLKRKSPPNLPGYNESTATDPERKLNKAFQSVVAENTLSGLKPIDTQFQKKLEDLFLRVNRDMEQGKYGDLNSTERYSVISSFASYTLSALGVGHKSVEYRYFGSSDGFLTVFYTDSFAIAMENSYGTSTKLLQGIDSFYLSYSSVYLDNGKPAFRFNSDERVLPLAEASETTSRIVNI